ncbi:hypothetical protein LMH87_002609 [Akanthomyces muscarius]|uniref:Uncharacterized protein n=2 Tax=Akanthomyces TaxID=150366 RepID=A0A168FVE6_CORDF|nr:hypothetical protein LMH87_002609 [Akanthomyces muscarius]KAJ4148123.1 hypothetical protein LMH87_002609 [Akanthomyces muscarius]OAA75667.1 hypothetical protein LEL_07655 [Akanthomyces lecanii RCEF 1005]
MAPYLPPSRTVPLHARQAASAATATVTVTVTSTPDSHGGAANLTGGAIAGIVIGSVVGVLLLIWVVRSCFNLGGPSPKPEIDPWYGRHEPKHHHRHHHHRRPRSSRRSRSSSLTIPPPPVVVRQETRSRGRRPSGSRNVYI